MANRCVSPCSEAVRSPSNSPVPGMTPADNQAKRPIKRPSSSPGTTGGAKWKKPGIRGKSPYSMAVGTPRKWIPSHEVTSCRSWDWRPKSPDDFFTNKAQQEKLPQLENVQKIRDERMNEDAHFDKTVSSYLGQNMSIYTLVNEREELTAQVRRLTELVPRLESEYEQAERSARENLTGKHEAILEEKQRQLSKVESKLIVVEKELSLAQVKVQDADSAMDGLRGNIDDLRDFKNRSIENEKCLQGQIQDLSQRRSQLEKDLQESMKVQQETEAQLKKAKEEHFSLEKDLVRHQGQHSEAMQKQREDADRERQRRDDLEADLRRRHQNEADDLRKDMDAHRLQSQKTMQEAREQSDAASARYVKDTGALRDELHTEKNIAHKIKSEMKSEVQAEQEKLKEQLNLVRNELEEEKKSKEKLASAQDESSKDLTKQRSQLEKDLRESMKVQEETEAQMKNVEEERDLMLQEMREMQQQMEAMQKQFQEADKERQRRDDQEKQQVQQQSQMQKARKASPTQQQQLEHEKPAAVAYAAPKQQMNTNAYAAPEQKSSAKGQQIAAEAPAEESPTEENSNRQAPAMPLKSAMQKQQKPEEPENAEVQTKPVPKAKPVKKIERAGCVFWQVELKKTQNGESYGFTQISGKEWKLDSADGPEHWLVKRIMSPGLLDKWNQEHPDAEVLPTDRIVAVNEFTTLNAMQEAQQESQIKMTICRFPEIFELQLKKNGQKLGFMFEKPESGGQPEIRITKVLPEGALPESNRKEIKALRWHRVVLPEMCITAVNEVEGDATRLGEELRVCETVRLRIRRPKELGKEVQNRRSVLSGQGQVDDNELQQEQTSNYEYRGSSGGNKSSYW